MSMSRLFEHLRHSGSTRVLGHSTQRALRGHSEDTRTLRQLRHLGTQALRVLRHSGSSAREALRHLSTRVLGHLGDLKYSTSTWSPQKRKVLIDLTMNHEINSKHLGLLKNICDTLLKSQFKLKITSMLVKSLQFFDFN